MGREYIYNVELKDVPKVQSLLVVDVIGKSMYREYVTDNFGNSYSKLSCIENHDGLDRITFCALMQEVGEHFTVCFSSPIKQDRRLRIDVIESRMLGSLQDTPDVKEDIRIETKTNDGEEMGKKRSFMIR